MAEKQRSPLHLRLKLSHFFFLVLRRNVLFFAVMNLSQQKSMPSRLPKILIHSNSVASLWRDMHSLSVSSMNERRPTKILSIVYSMEEKKSLIVARKILFSLHEPLLQILIFAKLHRIKHFYQVCISSHSETRLM